ncbi:MAG: hypothetical protein A2166_06580 [Omnitrophica WOR_2 bacterium RBG_13_41_10]|nr:MAG: hypothetical protein A2166_06580 [Omnitrophica WOR_2 bacterium RBG_13_41_10]
MKTHRYQRRFYRDWIKEKDLYLTRIAVKETDLQILTDKPLDKNFIKEKICLYRWQIENYLTRDNRFLTALKPIAVELNAPAIIKKMSQAAKLANVGPMAAVAGAMAEFLGKDLLRKGFKEVIIENGGDIFMKTRKSRSVGIYAGKSKLWKKLKLKIKPKKTPIGICTSSGTIGHSLSFGYADSVVILSRNASLADALATATANLIESKQDLPRALDFTRSIKMICGAVIIFKNNLISWGSVEFKK